MDRAGAVGDLGRQLWSTVGGALGEHPNRLRYAAPTGTVLIRWDGARQPTVWSVPAPEVDPREARLELARRYGCTVVGVDQSADMLAAARRRVAAAGRSDRITLLEARAEALPFAAASFDGLTFTYLLRYVDDPEATLRELARVVRPGGRVAALEFHVPRNPAARLAWEAYTRVGLPVLGRAVSHGWGDVGRFLGPSIRDFYRRYPLERQLELWRAAGIERVQARTMSFGGGVVIWGTRGD